MSASNVSPATAEAGLFQMSYDIGVGSSNPARAPLKNLYDALKLRPYDGYRSIFAQNVRCTSGQLGGFGTTPGGEFRKFCIMEPALSAEVAALALRMRRRHWGPIGEFTVTLNQDCDALLKDVQQMVDVGSCCSDLVPQLPPPA